MTAVMLQCEIRHRYRHFSSTRRAPARLASIECRCDQSRRCFRIEHPLGQPWSSRATPQPHDVGGRHRTRASSPGINQRMSRLDRWHIRDSRPQTCSARSHARAATADSLALLRCPSRRHASRWTARQSAKPDALAAGSKPSGWARSTMRGCIARPRATHGASNAASATSGVTDRSHERDDEPVRSKSQFMVNPRRACFAPPPRD